MTPSPALTSRQHTDAMMGLLHGDYVVYYPRVAEVCGNIKSAILLSQALSWTSGYLRQNPGREGWFWKTREEWFLETGLSRWEQESARERLKKLGVLEEKRRGAPPKLFFRVNLDQLGRLLSARFDLPFEHWDWSDTPAVRGMLGARVILYRKLAHAVGGVLPALYLSKVIHAHRLALQAQTGQEWLALPVLGTRNRLGLGRYEAQRARRLLIELGLIEEQSERRVTPRKLTRLNPGRVYEIVLQASKGARPHQSAIPECAEAPFWNAGNPPTGVLENHLLESWDPTARPAANPPPSRRETSIPGIALKPSAGAGSSPPSRARINNTDSFTQQLPIPKAADSGHQHDEAGSGGLSSESLQDNPGPSGSPSLIFPSDLNLQEQEQQSALKFLSFAREELRQAVLDEWVGQLRQKTRLGKPVLNRLGYLNGIVRCARLGQFCPTVGLQIASEREVRQLGAASLEQRAEDVPANRAVIEQNLSRIRALLGTRGLRLG
ncbi:MAG: hypothetical protein WBX11_13955 [Thiobacillaceae bacterium]